MTRLTYQLHPFSARYVLVVVKDDVQATVGPRLLSSASDLHLLLLKEEERFVWKTASKEAFTGFHLPCGKLPQLLKLVSAQGALYMGCDKLMVDFFRPATLHFRMQPMPDGGAEVEGILSLGSTSMPFSASRLVLPSVPPWVEMQGFLRPLSQDVAYQWLFAKRAWSPKEVRDYEKNILSNPDLPKIEWLQKPPKSPSSDVLPRLVLSDPRGAFANLFFIDAFGQQRPYSGTPEDKIWEEDLQEAGYQKKTVGATHYFCPLDRLPSVLQFLLEIGWEILDHQRRVLVMQTGSALQTEAKGQYVEISGAVHFGDKEAGAVKVAEAIKMQMSLVPLSPTSVGLLDAAKLPPAPFFLQADIVHDKLRIRKEHAGLAGSDFLDEIFQEVVAPLIDKSFVPSGKMFQGTLRPYQQDGLNWMASLYRARLAGLLADEMGLGKTVQCLAFLSTLPEQARVLIVAPTSLLHNWKSECGRFVPCKHVIVHSSQNPAKKELLQTPGTWAITSYGMLRTQREVFEGLWEVVIIDEAQSIKNSKSQIAEAVCALQAHMRLSLTGTPIENCVEELWSQFRFLLPHLLGPLNAFQKMWQTPQERKLVAQKVAPFLLRRKKSDVARDLPEKIEQVVWVEMEEQQQMLYQQMLQKGRSLLKEALHDGSYSVKKMQILETILRLRQICCHPHLVESTSEIDCAKWQMCLQDLQEIVASEQKVLVFSQFTTMLDLFQKKLQLLNIPFFYLTGKTVDRAEVVGRFQESQNGVFLISLKAGGVGLNLNSADYVLLYDPWWNDAVENQAIDRAHRIGRRSTLVAKRYIIANSIEEKMMEMKKKKSHLLRGLFSQAGKSLTQEDAEFLLSE